MIEEGKPNGEYKNTAEKTNIYNKSVVNAANFGYVYPFDSSYTSLKS